MRYKYTDTQIIEAVKKSKSVLDVLRILGASITSGGVHNHFSNRIKKLGIDTSHFAPYSPDIGFRRKLSCTVKIPYERILVYSKNGRRTKSYQLRRAMIESGIKYECAICFISTWMNRPIGLHIEHKDGDCLNNDYRNVIFLCPNCHSQTETYCIPKNFSGCGGSSPSLPTRCSHMLANTLTCWPPV